jgi:DNA-binding Lrp family transcriptional regulator
MCPTTTWHLGKTLTPDALGKLILPKSYQWNFRETNSQLARRLGVSPETIRLTLKRLRKTGSVPEWRLIINPHLIGGFLAIIELDVGEYDRKRIVMSNLAQIDGVINILNFFNKGLRVLFYCDDDGSLERKISLISALCGSLRDDATWWRLPLPACQMKFKRTDWEILLALRKDPLRSSSSLARDVHTSTRTVNRRLSLMTSDHVGWLMPIRQIANSKGLTCSYLVQGEVDDHLVDELIISASGTIDFSARWRSDLCARTVALHNISKAEELTDSLKRLPGVTRVKMNLPKEFIAVDAWIDGRLENLAHGTRRPETSELSGKRLAVAA